LGAWLSLGLVGAAAGQIAQGTVFTYQGVLQEAGFPASGEYDIRFRLFNAATGGAQVGATLCRDNVSVNQGLFDVSLDFGATAFTGSARWLEISVRAGGAPGNCAGGAYTPLASRQALTPSPGAIFSNLAGGAVGTFTILEGSPARVSFGSSGLCTIGIDSAGPAGVVLRDPIGMRIMPPVPTPPIPSRLLFGPTDDCSLGIDPSLRGLILRDPNGGRLINPTNGPTRLLFGPTDDCRIGIDPALTGLILYDPRGVRVCVPTFPVDVPTRLLFGPTDDCTVGIDPSLTGLILRDPSGPRLINPVVGQPTSLIFGPTNDCRISIDPSLTGLILYDPRGVRICVPPTPIPLPPRILFGPTDDCTIGIDPTLPGLILRDPRGVRVNPPNPGDPPVILFGPTDLCSVGTSPQIPGLILTDPRGIRLLNPEPSGQTSLLFGPTDDCRIFVSPPQVPGPGMTLLDPRGFQFLGGFVLMGATDPREFRLQLPTTNDPGGQALANRWIDASSRRWKENIRPIDDAMDKLTRLTGVYFDWKKDHGGNPGMGFIAEDVGQVFPEVVAWEANGKDASGISYDHLVAVAVEAIKSQHTEIAGLKAENADLRARLERIERLLRLEP